MLLEEKLLKFIAGKQLESWNVFDRQSYIDYPTYLNSEATGARLRWQASTPGGIIIIIKQQILYISYNASNHLTYLHFRRTILLRMEFFIY